MYIYTCTKCEEEYVFERKIENPEKWVCKPCLKAEEEAQGDMTNFDGGVIDSEDMKGR